MADGVLAQAALLLYAKSPTAADSVLVLWDRDEATDPAKRQLDLDVGTARATVGSMLAAGLLVGLLPRQCRIFAREAAELRGTAVEEGLRGKWVGALVAQGLASLAEKRQTGTLCEIALVASWVSVAVSQGTLTGI